MSVTYAALLGSRKSGRLIRLLARWRAGVFKALYYDLLIFFIIYYTLQLVYIHALDSDAKKTFEALVIYCKKKNELIPLSFVLGFYVGIIIVRWWKQYMTMPWPDSLAVLVSCLIHGNDDVGRLMRRTVMRYVCLSFTMVLMQISPPVRRRFSSLDKLVDVGLLMANERDVYRRMDAKYPKISKYWMPIVWATSILAKGRLEGRIRDDFALRTLIDGLNSFRRDILNLLHFYYVSIPLVYTQVVTLAVYIYCFVALLGRQWIKRQDDDSYFSFAQFYYFLIPVMEYFFYVGWLKVAEVIICPFGDDDEDFEVNWLIDRNLSVVYLIVDEMHNAHPELLKDQYWDTTYPDPMPDSKTADIQHGSGGITSLFTRKDQYLLMRHSSYEIDIHKLISLKRRHSNQIYFDAHSSELSQRGMQNSIHSTDEQESEEELLLAQEIEMDLFDQLREEREKARNDRPVFALIPLTISKINRNTESSVHELMSKLSSAITSDLNIPTQYTDEEAKYSQVTVEDIEEEEYSSSV